MQKAKEQGDFLLVGLHTDEDVSERRGPHLPIMDLHERCLSVLACKYVDEVIIGARPHLCCSITCSMSHLKGILSPLVCTVNLPAHPASKVTDDCTFCSIISHLKPLCLLLQQK